MKHYENDINEMFNCNIEDLSLTTKVMASIQYGLRFNTINLENSKIKTDKITFVNKIKKNIFYNQLFNFNNNSTKTKIITNPSQKSSKLISNFD